MTFDEYQKGTDATALYPGHGTGSPEARNYAVVGVGAEAGEVLNKWAKFLRGDNDYMDRERLKQAVLVEIGGVLWQAARVCTEFGVSMEQVATMNLELLAGRKERNTIQGSGDDR